MGDLSELFEELLQNGASFDESTTAGSQAEIDKLNQQLKENCQ